MAEGLNQPLEPTYFASAAGFRAWLERNGATVPELLLAYYKKGSSRPSITYPESVDEALCFGWIDGVRRSFDESSFTIRFTPRKPRSIWSRINVAHVERLLAAGRMAKPGLAAFEKREESRTGLYSFERRAMALAPAYLEAFSASEAAWAYFQEQAPWYRRTSAYWVMSAKKPETRAKRLAILIDCSAKRTPIPQLARPR